MEQQNSFTDRGKEKSIISIFFLYLYQTNKKKRRKRRKKRRKEEARKANGQEIWTIIVQEKNGRSMTRENSSTAAARLDDSMKILAWKKRWIDVKS